MTKITHSVRFLFKYEQEGGQFLDSPSYLFFVTVLGGSAVEKPPFPAVLRRPIFFIFFPAILSRPFFPFTVPSGFPAGLPLSDATDEFHPT